jgi:hypothetical protein
MVQLKGARSGLSLRKAAYGEATFHARPHCVDKFTPPIFPCNMKF